METTLYYSPGACSLAPHIVLEEIGEPFTLSLASTSGGGTRSATHLRLNPKGRVPVLVTEHVTNGRVQSEVLTEAPAILLYLAMRHPAAGLLANTADGLVRSVEWFNWLSSSVHAVAVRQIWRPETFIDESLHPNGESGVIAKGKLNLAAAFGLIESRLQVATWAVGDNYSIVDAYLLVFYRWGNRMGINMRALHPQWTAHTERVLLRPAVQGALASEGVSVWE